MCEIAHVKLGSIHACFFKLYGFPYLFLCFLPCRRVPATAVFEEAGIANHPMNHIFDDIFSLRLTFFPTFLFDPTPTISCIISALHTSSWDVLHYHSARARPLGSLPYPHTIIYHLLIHRRWHPNLSRLLNTHCSDNDCHIHSSGIHSDPPVNPFDRNAYLYRHGTCCCNRIYSRCNTSVGSSDSAICCAE